MPDFTLDAVETRVLGALIEKEITTPEYYPLTLNALVNACNQRSNREPVVSYDEDTVSGALESLRRKGLASVLTGAGIRVPKHSHRFSEKLNLGRRELAILCELMLRGRQTAGELRDRAGRMHGFADLEEVESVLARLIDGEPEPLVVRLPKQPGTKEPRYAHLLSGEIDVGQETVAAPPPKASPSEDRISALESEVGRLAEEVRSLREELMEFRKQFE
jgi:uncharacterized protein YceH (UPF0502 family)